MLCALIQQNPKVGDIQANCGKLEKSVKLAASFGATLAIAPEMAIIGYPPRDLLLYSFFIQEAREAALELAANLSNLDMTLIVGSVANNPNRFGRELQNVALVLEKGQIKTQYAKRLLPTYDVFDEARYFEPGQEAAVVMRQGLRLALTICEDIWNDFLYWPYPLYRKDPLANHPPFDVLVNISASPFSAYKQGLREDMMAAHARHHKVQTLYVNQVGANDELIFDGRSFHLDPTGKLLVRAAPFEEDMVLCDLGQGRGHAITPEEIPTIGFPQNSVDNGINIRGKKKYYPACLGLRNLAPPIPIMSPEEEVYKALTVGVYDYCKKNGFKTITLGLSGGIDSSLTAAIAAEAVGPENVIGVLMPSPYSSGHSLDDALELCGNLGIPSARVLPIEKAMTAFTDILAETFKGLRQDTTEENVQARIRGVLLMAVANKFGSLLLTTGNKSEIAVGYCTIYGDMCGALAVIGDLYKTEVFKLSKWLNATKGRILIPENTIAKPPSAELRPNQTDQDNLPPYEELDEILKFLVEDREGPGALEKRGFNVDLVRKVANLVRLGEFKRRQSAPVLKVSSQAFGVGWRMPITCASVFSARDPVTKKNSLTPPPTV
ncbi:MAG: NAD+ synthase [Deltaproteobacteria bacterium]|nr:NAD+ synthase [Deltaproteobacteria bacterium]